MQRLQRLLPFVTLIALAAALTIATPHFLTVVNLSSVARQTAVINIIALGMTLVIITGGIDLSVGSTLAISGLFGSMAIKSGQPVLIAIAIGIGSGVVCGLFNGLMITRLRISLPSIRSNRTRIGLNVTQIGFKAAYVSHELAHVGVGCTFISRQIASVGVSVTSVGLARTRVGVRPV